MSSSEVSVTFKCPQCGGTEIRLPDDHTDDSTASCKDCGVSFGRWGDIKERAQKLVLDKAKGEFRKAFKGLKGWKVK